MNRSRRERFSGVFIGFLIITIILTGCSATPAKQLSTTEQAEVLVYAIPKVDKLVAAITAHDFTAFSADFDGTMHSVMGASNFDQMMSTLDNVLGVCGSRKTGLVYEYNNFIVTTHTLVCAKASAVIMQVSFEITEPHRVSGVFFDSPELRQK